MPACCDCHVHIVGDPRDYPLVATRTYTPGMATLATLQRIAAPVGVTRFVIVQPSFYGADNSLLLETLDALDGRGRGVVTVDPATAAPAMLGDMAARGVRGLRINLYSTLSAQQPRALDRSFAALAEIARTMSWHIEVLAPIAMLGQTDALQRADVPVVIDHYGLYAGAAPDSAEGRGLLKLLHLDHVWLKLSAPYRCSDDALACRPDPAWLAALLDAAGERCVWGSDWPHTPPHALQTGDAVALPYRDLDYAAVVGGFRAALADSGLADAGLADRIMQDHAARLYEFAP